jgi:mycothiol synthase
MGQRRQLCMIRHDLNGLPEIKLPTGCEIRTYLPGDEEIWAEIMNTGIGVGWTAEDAEKLVVGRPQFDPESLFFAMLNGLPVGSACAWRQTPDESRTGYVHMVCVVPEARGMNLGYLLTLRVLHYFRDHGFSEACLETDDERLPAIKSYLRLGFEPHYYDNSHVERWRDVTELLAASL